MLCNASHLRGKMAKFKFQRNSATKAITTEYTDSQHIPKNTKKRAKKSLNFFKKITHKIWILQINLVPLHRI